VNDVLQGEGLVRRNDEAASAAGDQQRPGQDRRCVWAGPAMSAISHNPLLAALCRSITAIQIGLAVKLSGGSIEDWRRAAGSLHRARMGIADRSGPRGLTAAHFRSWADTVAKVASERSQSKCAKQPNPDERTFESTLQPSV